MSDILVDAHLDMAYNAVLLGRDLSQPLSEIRSQELQNPPVEPNAGTSLVSLPTLRDGHVAVVGASIFIAPAHKGLQQDFHAYHTPEEAHEYGLQQLDYYRRLADEDAGVSMLSTITDLDNVLTSWESEQSQIGLFIVMEGADPIRDPGELAWWVERGLRGIALAWSSGSRYAGGNYVAGPVTDDGHELLSAMADYNLLLDISHLWEEAVYEALDRYPGPIVATHANPRAFVDSQRLLPDPIIRHVAERDGVIGIIPFNRMLKAGWRIGDPRLPLSRVAEAIDYVCQTTGVATAVGIGSDFDGGFGLESVPEGLNSVADLKKLAPLLGERGYTASDVDAILSGNWLRVMRTVLAATS